MKKRKILQYAVTKHITVLSLEEYSFKIKQSDGKIIMPKEIPSMGFVIFLDSENNMFGYIKAIILHKFFFNFYLL